MFLLTKYLSQNGARKIKNEKNGVPHPNCSCWQSALVPVLLKEGTKALGSLVQPVESLTASKTLYAAAKICSERPCEQTKLDRERKTTSGFNRQPHLLVKEPDSVMAPNSISIAMITNDQDKTVSSYRKNIGN